MVESEKGAIEISNSHQTKNNIGNGGKYTVFQKANLSCNPEFINLIHWSTVLVQYFDSIKTISSQSITMCQQ